EKARDALEQVRLFERRARAHECAESARAAARRGFPEHADGRRQRVLPRGVDPLAVVLDARREQPVLAVDGVAAEAVAIREPALVDRLVVARHDAAEPAAQHVPEKVAARAVVRAHERLRDHLPGARAVTIRLVVERPDGAQVDDVARQLVIDTLFYIGADLGAVAAEIRAELLDAGDFRAEPDAARAVDAARHIRRDQGPQILVFDDALPLGVARDAAPEAHREILELALPSLVADRAVERMMDEEELHRRFLRRDRALRAREDLHAFGDGGGASRQRLRRFLDLDQAHAAVRGDRELRVIAESRHVDLGLVRHLDDHLALARLQRHAVDLDVDDVGVCRRCRWRRRSRRGRAHAATDGKSSTTLLPLFSTMYSNSWRKCLMKLCTGHAAASPNAQIVWPSILFATSTSMSMSAFVPWPSTMRVSTRCNQPVPSRHGVHWPHDSA